MNTPKAFDLQDVFHATQVDLREKRRFEARYDFEDSAEGADWLHWSPTGRETDRRRHLWKFFQNLPRKPLPRPFQRSSSWSIGKGVLIANGWTWREYFCPFSVAQGSQIRVDLVPKKAKKYQNLMIAIGDNDALMYVVGIFFSLPPKLPLGSLRGHMATSVRQAIYQSQELGPAVVVLRGPLPLGAPLLSKAMPRLRSKKFSASVQLRAQQDQVLVIQFAREEFSLLLPTELERAHVWLHSCFSTLVLDQVTISGTLSYPFVRKARELLTSTGSPAKTRAALKTFRSRAPAY